MSQKFINDGSFSIYVTGHAICDWVHWLLVTLGCCLVCLATRSPISASALRARKETASKSGWALLGSVYTEMVLEPCVFSSFAVC